MRTCSYPKKEKVENNQNQSSSFSSFTTGAKNGFIYSYLFKLFTSQGMEESHAQLAAEGAIAAGLFSVSPVGALIYVGANHIPFEKLGMGEYGAQAANILSTAFGMYVESPWSWIKSTVSYSVGNLLGGWLSNVSVNLFETSDNEKNSDSVHQLKQSR